jgi:electron transport complex protein RnfD
MAKEAKAENPKLVISAAPHIKDDSNVSKIMWQVVLALIPALIGATYLFGARALWLTILGGVTAVVTEALIQKFIMKQPVTISDGSALVTGILVSFNVSPAVPWWMPVVGSVFAIAIGKMPFGGLGNNPLNPALLGRAFLLASWPVHMTGEWLKPLWYKAEGFNFFSLSIPTSGTGWDTISTATPLGIIKEGSKSFPELLSNYDYLDMFLGRIPGVIGETSVILLLIGAGYMLYKKIIGLRIPLSYILTVFILSEIIGVTQGNPMLGVFHLLTGGLMLGAFFMATDMVTSPVTPAGRIWFGIGCGVLTVVIRFWGGYPEGVSYSILLMNIATPLIDRYTRPKILGAANQKK